MTSACIFKDTLRNDTQVFLKFRNSIFEICLRIINSSFTSNFLLPLIRSSGAATSKEVPLKNSEVSLPAIPITLLFSFFKSNCSSKKFFNFISHKSTCHPIFRLILTCSMSNKHLTTQNYPNRTRRLFSIPQRCQAMIPEKCHRYLPLHHLNHKL